MKKNQARQGKRTGFWGQKGFTLVELLILLAIVGVFAAVIMPYSSQLFGAPVVANPQEIDAFIVQGASLLDENAAWIDRDRGRNIYRALKGANKRLVTESLVRRVFAPEKRLQVLFLGVKLGIPGSQEKLVDALLNHGDKAMAEDYLNSGSPELYQGGKRWAQLNGYSVHTGMGSHRASWGEF